MVEVWSTLKMQLSCHDQSNRVWSMMKTRQDKDMINSTGAIYTENEIELLWFIGSSVVYD